jgi:hypothetical protein
MKTPYQKSTHCLDLKSNICSSSNQNRKLSLLNLKIQAKIKNQQKTTNTIVRTK